MAKYKVTLTQKSESTHGEHSGWTHYHTGPYTVVEAEFPFTGSILQVGSSNGSGIGHFRGWKWMSDSSIETARAYMFSGRGRHDGSWSGWTAPPVLKDFDLTSNYQSVYEKDNTGGYSSAEDWAAGQAGWKLKNDVRTFASPSDIAYTQGYTNHLYGAFAFIWDTVDKKFVTGQECIDNGVITVNGYDPITGGGGRYVLAMISSAPITPSDNTPPTISGPTYNSSDVTLVGPDIYVKTSSITISYSATDTESGVAGIWIDGVQASSSGSASKTYTVTADFTSSAYARDNASNQSPTVSQLFKFDNIPPTISNFIVNSATTSVSGQDFFVDYPNTTCDFEFTVTDNESGLNSYKATNASGVVTTGSLSGASQTITLSHDLNEANSSEIKYELEVEDIAGNISTQSSPIVIVDNTPPTGTLAIDSSQAKNVVDGVTYIKTSDVKLSITKSDSESGLF